MKRSLEAEATDGRGEVRIQTWSEEIARLWADDAPMASDLGNPPVWVMQSDRPGDNMQARAVAQASGLPFELRHIVPIGGTRAIRVGRRFDPARLDFFLSSKVEPPWPDIIIAAGQWPATAALWVKQQSGGRTRVVLIGRPKPGQFDHVSLVIAPSQYLLPRHPKVIPLDLPPAGLVREALDDAVLPERLRATPRPLTVLLVGGRTSPFRFGAAEAARLADEVGAMLGRDGGSLVVLTSPRTQPEIAEALRASLPPAAMLFDWRTLSASDNPFLALLTAADRFVVTGDSVSMLVEVASLGRPLAIYRLPRAGGLAGKAVAALRAGLVAHRPKALARALRDIVLVLHRAGLLGFPRDIEVLHARLLERRLAVPFGEAFPEPTSGFRVDLRRVGARIRKLRSSGAQPRPQTPTAREAELSRNQESSDA